MTMLVALHSTVQGDGTLTADDLRQTRDEACIGTWLLDIAPGHGLADLRPALWCPARAS